MSSDLFADLVPGTGGVQLSVGPSTALDVAALLKALDRYPFGCSEQTTSRALPLLYVNELASEAHLSLDAAIDQRIRDAIERMLARQGSNGSFGLWGSGGDDIWLDAYVTDFLTRARERNFAVPDVAFKSGARPPAQSRRRRAIPPRTVDSDLTYAYYVLARNGDRAARRPALPRRHQARRAEDARSPRRSSPRRSACSATAPAPSASTTRRSPTSRRSRSSSSAAPTTARRCATRPPSWRSPRKATRRVPRSCKAVERIEAARDAHALHLDAGERLDGARGPRARARHRRHGARRRGRDANAAPLYRSFAAKDLGDAGARHQQRRRTPCRRWSRSSARR